MQESRRHLSLLVQLRVVLMSYFTRPGLRWAMLAASIGAGMFGSAVLIAKANGHSWTEGDPVGSVLAVFGAFTGLFGVIGFVLIFLLHARQQLIGWTARVFPHARLANLLVAGAALPAFATLITLLTKHNYYHALGLFAVWFGVLILASYAALRPWLLFVIVIGGWALFHYVPMLEFNLNLLTADRERIDQRQGPMASPTVITREHFRSLQLVSGEPIPLGILDRLADDQNRLQFFQREMRQHYYDLLQTRRIALFLADIIAFIGLLPLTRPSRQWHLAAIAMMRDIVPHNAPARRTMGIRQHNPITSRFARSLHRRIATHDWRAAGVSALAMAVLSVWFNLQFRVDFAVAMLTIMLAFLPGALVAIGWRERWPTFEFESLYPVSRRELIADMAVGLMMDIAEFWIASALAVVVVCAALRTSVLHEPRFWIALLAGGMMQFLWLGGIFFVGQRRQLASYIAGLTPGVVAMFLPLESLWRSAHPMPAKVSLLIASIELLAGLSLFVLTWAVIQRSPHARQVALTRYGQAI